MHGAQKLVVDVGGCSGSGFPQRLFLCSAGRGRDRAQKGGVGPVPEAHRVDKGVAGRGPSSKSMVID